MAKRGGDSVNLADLRCNYRRDPTNTNYDTERYLSGSDDAVFFNGVAPQDISAYSYNWAIIAELRSITHETDGWPVQMILPGTFPGFTNLISGIQGGTADTPITITRTASSLKINNKTFSVTSTNNSGDLLFPDGVIPLRLVVVLQAAGGGGGGNQDRAAGGGGGGGGCAVFVLDLLKYPTVNLELGKHGTGGKAKLAGSEGYGNGTSANDSLLYTSDYYSPLIKAGGGKYGVEGNNAVASAGGAGGTVSGDTTFLDLYRVSTTPGGKGGNGAANSGTGGKGGGVGSPTARLCTPRDEAGGDYYVPVLNDSLTMGGYSGGAVTGNAGSGGASCYGDGGYSGGYLSGSNSGGTGGTGAGGGGGRYVLAQYNSGGAGGPAYVEFYY